MRNSYITTTFKDLDDAIGGFTQASLVTIAGLPGARGENFIYLHTVCHRTGNPTIDACFDADRLDLMRVGIIPDPKRMATERGTFYAANMGQFYADTKINDEDLPF